MFASRYPRRHTPRWRNALRFSSLRTVRTHPACRYRHHFFGTPLSHPGECVLLCFGCVYERDPTLAKVSDLPRGWSAYRKEIGAAWERWEASHEKLDEDEVGQQCDRSSDGDAKALADIASDKVE